MIQKAVVHRQVEKKLESLGKGHKKAGLVKSKALVVMDEILQRPEISRLDAGLCTYNGEARIKGCIKFDLGAGFRLVTLRYRNCLHFVFLGSHDECDRWLEKHSRMKRKSLKDSVGVIQTRRGSALDGAVTMSEENQQDYDEMLMERITQKDLRTVFSGLCSINQMSGNHD